MKHQSKANVVMSDEKIIDLYWQRNEQAIKETDIKYRKYLLSVGMNIVHNMPDSEECLNDTYIGAWNAIPPAKPILLQAFLTTIMRRTAINRFNANKTQKRIVSDFAVPLFELEYLIADEGDLRDKIETKELAKSISNYVRSLPDRQMCIFVSRYYISNSLSEISKELGCSISTVKRELTLIKDGLKKWLEEQGYIL